MDFRTKNGFLDLQVILKELGLYGGVIDGAWGSGTASATVALLRPYVEHIGRGPLDAASLPSRGGEDGKIAVIALQQAMASIGLYLAKVDGIWGKGTADGIAKAAGLYVSKHRVPSYDLCWSKLVPTEFARKVTVGCAQRGYPQAAAHWLMGCMAFESGRTFSPSKQNNGGSNYFGLIQFGELAAKDLAQTYKVDITLDKLKKMSQLEQLEWVFKYFDMWAKRGKKYTQLEDFYLTIFYPAAVGRKADETLFRKNSSDRMEAKSFLQNNGFDKNKDDVITIGEICTTIYDIYYQGMDPANRVVNP